MAQSVITSAFERLKAQEAAGGNRIIIDQFIFANLPGQDADATPSPDETIPAAEHIVHTQQVDKNGMVNENTVAYSVTLPESAGNFTFNWLGLVSSATNTLCMVVYLHPQEKIKTADGIQGNVLVYSEIMEYAGASVATGITTPVSTWQIDFTARLHGMDEATRKAALDIYGPGVFFDDAFKLTASGTGQATFAPGIAYLRGLRVELETSGTLTFPTGVIQTVYLDAALTGTLTGENKATFSLTSKMTADYTDSSGFSHYVEPVATISASGLITDIRKTRRPLHKRLEGEFLTRGANLSDVQDKARSRESLEVYSKTESDKSYLARNQNGADIPDKPLFVQNIGLKETLNPTKRVSIGNTGTGAFDGSTPCINIGDSDSGFIGSADGVLDIYCNNAKVGYIDNDGLHMLAGIATNKNLILRSDERRHIIMQNADGSVRAYIYKDKDDTGIHINNGVDGSGDFILGKDNVLYVPFAVRAGGSKKLAIQSNNNSALNATFNLWGDANRPTVIELGDDQGWHLYSQRNPDGSILSAVNGSIMASTALHSGDATLATDGNVYGTIWGGWLNDWINNNLSRKNTASLETNGWFKDASTGLIIQWGITGGNLNKAVVNLPIPFPNAGLWSLGWVAGTLDMGNDDWSNSASLLNNSQLMVTTDHWWSTAWIAIGK